MKLKDLKVGQYFTATATQTYTGPWTVKGIVSEELQREDDDFEKLTYYDTGAHEVCWLTTRFDWEVTLLPWEADAINAAFLPYEEPKYKLIKVFSFDAMPKEVQDALDYFQESKWEVSKPEHQEPTTLRNGIPFPNPLFEPFTNQTTIYEWLLANGAIEGEVVYIDYE